MKKLISVLLIVLFAVNILYAQTGEPITNNTILKMVKGKLSDDLIIDEINSSKVNFDLSDEAVKTLSEGNVSDNVIDAMKTANGIQNTAPPAEILVPVAIATPAVIAATQAETSTVAAAVAPAAITGGKAEEATQTLVGQVADTSEPAAGEEPVMTEEETTTPIGAAEVEETASQPEKEPTATETAPSKALLVETIITESGALVTIEKPTLTIDALSYVIPVAELIPFYNSEFESFAGVIKEWDKKIRTSLEKERQNTEEISRLEKELTDLKNASAKPFSNQIREQKKNLVSLWEKHKAIKAEMVNEGKTLVEDLKKISKETESTIDEKFKEVSKNVKNADPNPSAGETAKAIDIPLQKYKSTITGYFAPVTMMLVCYQNEIITIQNTIAAWNKKVLDRIQKDAELKSRLSPLQEDLMQYLATSKQEQKVKKKEISALKKQCDGIEKERKQLVKQMNSDSDKLSEELNKLKVEVQGVVRERFADIIENIEHSYQDKFNL
jgi:predicted  nucleic acid-binding Zn-ribbon protein